jgi:hypothetical protein
VVDLRAAAVYPPAPLLRIRLLDPKEAVTLFDASNRNVHHDQGRMKDYYALLGIESDASLSVVKSAYRKKASEFHPDRNTSPEAPARFREIQEAYDLLSDEEKRKGYDENRRRNLVEKPIDTAKDIWTTYMNKVLQ